ncbi:hypothetical protein BH23ACT7_BH23ACT7_27760 [soil metagenome]
MGRSAPRRSSRTALGPLGAAAALASARRRALGLTQRELGELAGVGERTIQALEAGKGTLRVDLLIRALDAVGLAVAVVPRSQGRRLVDGGAALLRPGRTGDDATVDDVRGDRGPEGRPE